MDNSMMGGGLLPAMAAASAVVDLDPPVRCGQHQFPNPSPGPRRHPQRTAPMILRGVSPSSSSTFQLHRHGPGDEDEDSTLIYNDDGPEARLGGGKTQKVSPWHRMKWTGEMVRFLISVVARVEDESVPEAGGDVKRKHGGGALQKKGKWRTVSKLMLGKGCSVSPQQCEDKFNDLNKRYKRLNEILGWGTTCQVVENPALLDSMHHVSAKEKEDVRKILSSKHLFYREMCAYHHGQSIPCSNEFEMQSCAVPGSRSSGVAGDEGDDGEEDEENGEFDERKDEIFGRCCENFQVETGGVVLKWSLQLQEERTAIQMRTLELENGWFKWQRFCSKKDRELERMRLENERMRLENEQIGLQVRQREAELDLMGSAEYEINREEGKICGD